jgi:membrane associated rhomboid family serine protease
MDLITSNLIIIVLTCVVSYTAFNNAKLMDDWILIPYKIQHDKQFYRYVTHGFLHADGTHLLVNMITLYSFGPILERFYFQAAGVMGYPLFYVIGIVVAIIPTVAKYKDAPSYRGVGASGAISAVLFASILFDPWSTILVLFIIPCPAIVFAVLYVAFSIWRENKGGDKYNHSAHLWGAAYGVAATLLIQPSVLSHFLNQLMSPFS